MREDRYTGGQVNRTGCKPLKNTVTNYKCNFCPLQEKGETGLSPTVIYALSMH